MAGTQCRCCLSSSSDNQQLLPLFEENRAELFRECTGLPAKIYDLLSKWICETCLSKCNKWKHQQTEHIKRQKAYYEKFRLLIPVPKPNEKDILKYPCGKCTKRYKQENQLQFHIQMEHNDESNLFCKICSITFGTIIAHKNHFTKIHSKMEKPKRTFECDQCDAKYTLKSSLRTHRKIHTTPMAFVCESCGKCFPHNRGLKNHLRVHSIDKPYKCTFCEMTYKTNTSLMHHIYLHNPEAKPHECTECSKKFVKKKDLKKHFANKHSTLRPFKCKYCSKSFAHSEGLTAHENLHQLGPFKCFYCNQILSSKLTLKIHMERHNPNPKSIISCEFCKRTGTNKVAMQYHRMTHTGEKPHQCTICDKKFIQKFTLNFHMRTQHKQKDEKETE